MDREFIAHKRILQTNAEAVGVGGLWKFWSKCVEHSWLRYLAPGKDMEALLKGRGTVNIIEKTPKPREPKKEEAWNKWYYKAIDQFRQARRCEQMAYRLTLLNQTKEKDKQDKYSKLNEEAWACLEKKADKHDGEEQEFIMKLGANETRHIRYYVCPRVEETSCEISPAP